MGEHYISYPVLHYPSDHDLSPKPRALSYSVASCKRCPVLCCLEPFSPNSCPALPGVMQVLSYRIDARLCFNIVLCSDSSTESKSKFNGSRN
jgi:hypothetical protein